VHLAQPFTALAIKEPIDRSIFDQFENGVPDDFKYLAVIESGLVNVVSKQGQEEFVKIHA
jgi:hypothetical protein